MQYIQLIPFKYKKPDLCQKCNMGKQIWFWAELENLVKFLGTSLKILMDFNIKLRIRLFKCFAPIVQSIMSCGNWGLTFSWLFHIGTFINYALKLEHLKFVYYTTCPHFKKKVFVDFLTSTLLRAQNMTLLSKVWWRFFSNFVAFSENPNFTTK